MSVTRKTEIWRSISGFFRHRGHTVQENEGQDQ